MGQKSKEVEEILIMNSMINDIRGGIERNLFVVNSVKGQIKNILIEELKVGNMICETSIGNWPYEGSIMIFLKKPFITEQKDKIGIEYMEINDTHYWKAEYRDMSNKEFLCCKFG